MEYRLSGMSDSETLRLAPRATTSGSSAKIRVQRPLREWPVVRNEGSD